jgi:hypothetical protein
MTERLRILVTGMVAADPLQGGATWAVLQYVLGLRRLGHDVYFVEPIAPASIRPTGAPLAMSLNGQYFHDLVARFDLVGRASLLRQDTRETIGVAHPGLVEALHGADVLINISGMLTDRALFELFPRRVYLDLDPAFNQLWSAVEGIDRQFEGHTHFFTVGQAIGSAACSVPTCGLPWQTTLPPIVLPEWPMTAGDAAAPWTTVGNWRGYGSIRHGGVLYGQKAHSVRRLIELPRRTHATLRLALSIHPAEVNDLEALHGAGWELCDPAAVTSTPDDYRAFIQQSKGEIGIAKSGYVESRCGWFSDRSVCYLASGRPVVAHDTGFSGYLPTGDGLLAFNTTDEAAAAIDAVDRDYRRHCLGARAIAESYFAADRVLGTLLDRIGSTGQPSLVGRRLQAHESDRSHR